MGVYLLDIDYLIFSLNFSLSSSIGMSGYGYTWLLSSWGVASFETCSWTSLGSHRRYNFSGGLPSATHSSSLATSWVWPAKSSWEKLLFSWAVTCFGLFCGNDNYNNAMSSFCCSYQKALIN